MASSLAIPHGLRRHLQVCDRSVEQQHWNFHEFSCRSCDSLCSTSCKIHHKFLLLTCCDSLGIATQPEVSPARQALRGDENGAASFSKAPRLLCGCSCGPLSAHTRWLTLLSGDQCVRGALRVFLPCLLKMLQLCESGKSNLAARLGDVAMLRFGVIAVIATSAAAVPKHARSRSWALLLQLSPWNF